MGYIISGWHGDTYLPQRRFLYYTKREAVKRFREHYNVKGKHLILNIQSAAFI